MRNPRGTAGASDRLPGHVEASTPNTLNQQYLIKNRALTRPSLRAAVNAMCKSCIYDPDSSGSWRQQVRECTAAQCPLHPVRPLNATASHQGRHTDLSGVRSYLDAEVGGPSVEKGASWGVMPIDQDGSARHE